MKSLARIGIARLPAVRAHRRFVFVYHDVSPSDAPQHHAVHSSTPELFGRHLSLLLDFFEFVSLDELLHGHPLSRRPRAAMTFDDGLQSFDEHAWPLLCAREVPVAMFVNQAAIERDHLPVVTLIRSGRSPRLDISVIDRLAEEGSAPDDGLRLFLSRKEVVRLRDEGVEIGSHGSTHRTLAGRTAPDLSREIALNGRYLDELLGAPPRFFALPYGKREHYDAAAIRACIDYGHEAVLTTNPGALPKAVVPAPILIPRIGGDGVSETILRFMINRAILRSPNI